MARDSTSKYSSCCASIGVERDIDGSRSRRGSTCGAAGFPSRQPHRRRGKEVRLYWIYILWAVNALIGVATRRNATLAIVRLVCVLTKDPDRAVRCAEILRLARKDAKDLPSYLRPRSRSHRRLLPCCEPCRRTASGPVARRRSVRDSITGRFRFCAARTQCCLARDDHENFFYLVSNSCYRPRRFLSWRSRACCPGVRLCGLSAVLCRLW